MVSLSDNPLFRFYNFLNHYLQDPRSAHLPLMQEPFLLFTILLIYNFGCIKIGPKLMEKRKPFNLKKIMIAFDLFQIIVNIYLFHQAVDIGWKHYNFFCAEINYEDNPWTRDVAFLCYLYFAVKLTDMLDTVFMVLRKKTQSITFLHMYHHTGMILMTWGNAKYLTGGHHTCLGLYNTLVHAVMYTYYLLSSLYPQNKMHNFKKLVTQLQMVQFLLIVLHMSTTLVAPDCNYPRWIHAVIIPNNALMFCLFYDFYRKTYVLKKKEKRLKSD